MGDITINSSGYGAGQTLRVGAGVGAAREAPKVVDAPVRADPTQGLTSPVGVVDPASGVYVLQFRDSKTGEVEIQYPSAKVVSAYKQGLIQNTSTPRTPTPPSTGSAPADSAPKGVSGTPGADGGVGGAVAGAALALGGAGGGSAAAGGLAVGAGSSGGAPGATSGASAPTTAASFTPTDTTA